jgi:hypothetical protein
MAPSTTYVTVIRMVERANGTGYWRAPSYVVSPMVDNGAIRMEGVDGDEEANTVTYWYARRSEDDE